MATPPTECMRLMVSFAGILYLGTKHGFLYDEVWPSRVATGVVDDINDCGCMVRWDNPIVVGKRYKGRTHVWYEDIAKVIPWD